MTRKKRILHVIDKLSMDGKNPSSCALCFMEWHKHRDADEYDVMVCSLRPPDHAGEVLENHGIKVFYIDKGKYSFKNVDVLYDLLRNESIDLVHLHGYASANFGRLAARRWGVPVVMHEWAVLKTLPHQFVFDWLLRKQTDVAVGLSESVKQFLIRGRRTNPNATRVVWPGVNLDKFQEIDPAAVQAFREPFNLAEGQKLVGTVTRLREEKGNRYFIEAAAAVLRETANAQFIIVGDGPQRDELAQLARRLGLDGRLHFTGFVSDVQVAFAAMDMYVMPSLTEGFGIALAEAMVLGKPVIASDVHGMRELVEHERDGLLVPRADSRALAAAILRLLRDPAFSQALGENAREKSEIFSAERSTRQLESIYGELLGNGRV